MPVEAGNVHLPIFISSQLGPTDVCVGAGLHSTDSVSQAVRLCPIERSFHEAKAPIWCPLGRPAGMKFTVDVPVFAGHCSPRKIPQHVPVFVLSAAVVTVKASFHLSHAAVVKEKAQ